MRIMKGEPPTEYVASVDEVCNQLTHREGMERKFIWNDAFPLTHLFFPILFVNIELASLSSFLVLFSLSLELSPATPLSQGIMTESVELQEKANKL